MAIVSSTGVVTAKKVGNATITVTSKDFTRKCKITVVKDGTVIIDRKADEDE